jgi:DNA-binding NtrC family response regulator
MTDDGLTGQLEPTHEALWDAMVRLLDEISGAIDRDRVVDACLDIVVDVVGADRGLVVLHGDGGAAHVVNARGKGRALDDRERAEVSRTIIHRARTTGELVVWDALAGETATDSVAHLGILFAIAAPLQTPGPDGTLRLRGVLYLDFRDPVRHIGERHRAFVRVSSVIVGAIAEQSQRLDAMRALYDDARARNDDDPWPLPDLEEMMRPASMAALRTDAQAALRGDMPVLILGESGTGKTALARAIAQAGGRAPVVRAVLGSSDDLNTITSELFGHERGSFSGAAARRIGTVEHANGGTLILDEILNLPAHAQQLLLDFTQFGTYRPLGWDGAQPKRSRVRIIAATHGDLEGAIAEGRFRQDLYFRLAGITLHVPPLRERRGDIPAIAEGILARVDPARAFTLSVELRRALMADDLRWPGNLRQLEWVIRRARDRASAAGRAGGALGLDDVAPHDLGRRASAPAEPAVGRPRAIDPDGNLGAQWQALQAERAELERLERALVEAALGRHAGVVARAARELDIARTSLSSRMDTLGLPRPRRGA